MKKTNIWLSFYGAVSAISFLVYLLLYNYLYRLMGEPADKLLFLPVLLTLAALIIGLWRIFYHSGRSFSPRLFWPVGVTVGMAVLIFTLSAPITTAALEHSFDKNQAGMTTMVEKLQKQEISVSDGLNTLPVSYNRLVPSGKLMVYETNAATDYLFLTLEHSTRLEGYLYLSDYTLRYEILDKYSSYEYLELDDHWLWVCFYK